MQKYMLYFGLFMSVIYVGVGLYFLLGSILGWTPAPFPYQNIIGGLLIGYGIFRIIRGVKQYKAINTTQ